jgi:hypothetical protein
MLAYCYALLGGRRYVACFEDELRTPGPRVPVTCDAALFGRAAELGERLLTLHTYRAVPAGQAGWLRPLGSDYPISFGFDAPSQTLRIGDGLVGPIDARVLAYSVSGMRPVDAWLRRRITPRAGKSPLDAMQPQCWTAPMTHELLELLWILEATLAVEPTLDSVLDEVVATSPADWLQVNK